MRNPDGKLPVVTETESNECGGGCDRRLILQGLAMAALAGACRIDVGDDAASDAPTGTDAPGGTGFALCGPNICVDLADPMNATIANVGGFRVIVQGANRIIIIRTSASGFTTLSARCTHAGGTLAYRVPTNDLRCPLHFSEFNIDGTVKGPAATAVREFSNSFDEPAGILTIMLT
jgi:Rieske Fe-S protein